MNSDSLPILSVLFAIGAVIGIVPIFVAAQFSRRVMTFTYVLEAALALALTLGLGTRAWTDTSSFNEPGEWMTIQAIQMVLIFSLAAGTTYYVRKRR